MKIKIQDTPLSPAQLAHMTEGTLIHQEMAPPVLRYICTDSREADDETLFCAIVGERVDGHDYIAAAMERGCRAVLCQKTPSEAVCAVVNEDTVAAMGRLAKAYRSAYLKKLKTVAVTGSVGKTTTKECIAAVLGEGEDLFKKEGNFNSTIGLPLSMMEITRYHTAAVLEMGMSGYGEIHAMSLSLCPDIACIINIGTSHMEHLGSREGICKAKAEIVDGMSEGGILLINGDEPLLESVETTCTNRGVTCMRVSLADPQAAFYAENIAAGAEGMTFRLRTPKGSLDALTVPAVGRHMVWAAAFAAAVGILHGMSAEDIRRGLLQYRPAGMRQNIITRRGITLIEDCYNAAPESMEAALSVLELTARTQPELSPTRRIAVLGDMKELGSDTVALHRAVGAIAAGKGIDLLVTVGDLGAEIAQGALEAGMPAETILVTGEADTYAHTAAYLRSILREGDHILFKASRAMTLETLAEAVLNGPNN